MGKENRRVFLERLGAGVLGGAALSQERGLLASAQRDSSSPAISQGRELRASATRLLFT